MIYFWWIAGGLLALVWGSRVVDRLIGGPMPDIGSAAWDSSPADGPRVSVIVAARNEEEGIAAALTSLLRLDYSNYEVILVEDRSTDRTGAIVDEIAANHPNRQRLRVIHLSDLPPGWLGKNHALWTGAQQATGEWLLFTDADVVYREDALRRVMAYIGQSKADHVVLMLTMVMESFGERMMMAFFPLPLYFVARPWAVSNPKAKDFVGMGAFNLVRRSAYEEIGTHRAMALEVIDDMYLGMLLKRAGHHQVMVDGHDLIRLRWARGAFGIVRNLEKNAFAVVRFRIWLALVFVVVGLSGNLMPWIGLAAASGWARAPFAVAVAAIAWLYWDMGRFTKLSTLWVLTHAPAAVLMSYGMLHSVFQTVVQGGVTWRGTKYTLSELRRHQRQWQ